MAKKMSAELLIKRELLLEGMDAGCMRRVPLDSAVQVHDAWDKASGEGWLHDAQGEFREGQEETGLPAPSSRHYESKAVARKMRDGTWVGWTCWYGGGKHGEPGSVPWIEEACLLEVKEEEKLVVVRTFEKVGR